MQIQLPVYLTLLTNEVKRRKQQEKEKN